jgi:hypothetical protein
MEVCCLRPGASHAGCVEIPERELVREIAETPSGIRLATNTLTMAIVELVLTARGLVQEADVREDPLDMAETWNPESSLFLQVKADATGRTRTDRTARGQRGDS